MSNLRRVWVHHTPRQFLIVSTLLVLLEQSTDNDTQCKMSTSLTAKLFNLLTGSKVSLVFFFRSQFGSGWPGISGNGKGDVFRCRSKYFHNETGGKGRSCKYLGSCLIYHVSTGQELFPEAEEIPDLVSLRRWFKRLPFISSVGVPLVYYEFILHQVLVSL